MQPKDKPQKGKKSGGKEKVPVGDDGDPKEMSKPQLERIVRKLRIDMEKCNSERNFYQLERDKLSKFWEISRQQLNNTKGELRALDRETGEKEEEHQRSLKVNKLKTKYLVHEQLRNTAEIQIENVNVLEAKQKSMDAQVNAHLQDKKILQEKYLEMQQMHQDEIRALKMELAEKLSSEREQLKTAAEDLEETYEERFKRQRETLTTRFNMEVAEIEERKNRQIAQLIKNHENSYDELKKFYNDITLNQMALISSLKEQMAERKHSEERMAMILKETQKENRNLLQPLQKAKADAAELSRQLINYKKDKQSLVETSKSLAAALKEIEALHWEREGLALLVKKLVTEKSSVDQCVKSAVEEETLKSGIKTSLIEGKRKLLEMQLQKRETQCAELLCVTLLKPETKDSVSIKVGNLLSQKNSIIFSLQQNLAHVVKLHNGIVDECQVVLQTNGMPPGELDMLNSLRISPDYYNKV